MKLHVKNIVIAFFVLLAVSGCVKKNVDCTSVNTYAIEKSAYYKKDNINNKIIDETRTLHMPYPYSVNMLLLSKEAISDIIPLADRGIMSEEYYLDKYLKEQSLIHLMFKKRNSFATLDTTCMKKINTPLNNKNYDYEIYFNSSTVGELEIYLKENITNRTFLIWNSDITKIDPIQAVENILNSRLIYCSFSETDNVHNTSFNDKIEKLSPKITSVQNINPDNTIRKSPIKTTNAQDTNPDNTIKKSSTKTNNIPYSNYSSITKDYSGCLAYGIFNQCVVW